MTLYCFFCAGRLEEEPPQWRCLACGALFRAERDAEGCILRLEVNTCGTPDCCRQEKSRP